MYYEYVVIDVISIRDGRILLVKKRDFWIFPGGKINLGEDVYTCLVRELGQELPKSTLMGGLVYFDEFFGKSPSGKSIKVICYIGNVEGDILPAAEISDARWMSQEEIFSNSKDAISEITGSIIQKLIEEKFF
jgi:ADP-ribose pyrophosphatase YjhB (NUDIX family)